MSEIKRNFRGVWIPREIYLHQELSWSEKILLVEIDSLSSEDGGCFASNTYLASFVGIATGTLKNILTKLTKQGLIKIGESGGNREIVVTIKRSAPEIKNELKLEVEEEPKKDETPYKFFMDSYNSCCNHMTPIKMIRGKRAEAVRARWNDVGKDRDEVARFFLIAGQADHLNGRSGATGKWADWKADFDWLMAPTNFQKVLEGKYKNKPKRRERQGKTRYVTRGF